ncbi:7-cyano-7-deazaguanine synthase [Candidatus Micrarchaeota archaeon]|nr:7-cyano-7-deazaguanine synthase [Candidatus Micrarchaeota archaeon]
MKGLLLLSGGIDSPVAGHLMKKKIEIEAVYFDNAPYADDTNLRRAADNAKKIGLKRLFVMNNGNSLKEYFKKGDAKFACVFCKRMMLRYSEALAEKIGADCLVNGDNLAQVASQTLQNLKTVSSAVSIPVVRPLIGMDKNEIIAIAKEIGTFDISTRPASCCSAVPFKPSTMASIDKMMAEESKVDVASLVSKSLKEMKELKL